VVIFRSQKGLASKKVWDTVVVGTVTRLGLDRRRIVLDYRQQDTLGQITKQIHKLQRN